jgi:hypothetical protein
MNDELTRFHLLVEQKLTVQRIFEVAAAPACLCSSFTFCFGVASISW